MPTPGPDVTSPAAQQAAQEPLIDDDTVPAWENPRP